MTIFNFTLRAEDDRGAFSDRQFSIKVRNTLVDRYMMVDNNHAYTSLDMVNWTERPDMGGVGCSYGGGNWMVWRGNNTYRMSPDGINWTQHTARYLVNDVPTNLPGAAMWSKPVWHKDRWFAICGTGNIISSDNGEIWTMVATNICTPSATNWPTLESTSNGCLVVNFNQTASNINAVISYPLISFDDGKTWEVAIKSTPAGWQNIVAHYSAQTVYRSAILKFINGLWYYAFSAQRSYYSGYNGNSQGARYHYVGYSHDLVNFTRCNTDSISATTGNPTTAMGGLIDDIHYANGVLLLSTRMPVAVASANPNYAAYSVDGRTFEQSTMAPINFHNTTYFMSQGKVYQCAANSDILKGSSDNGRNFTEVGTVPSSTVNDFARI